MALDLTKPLRHKYGKQPIEWMLLEDGKTVLWARFVREPGCLTAEWASHVTPRDSFTTLVENVPETRELDIWLVVTDLGGTCTFRGADAEERSLEFCATGNSQWSRLHIQRTYEVGEGLS